MTINSRSHNEPVQNGFDEWVFILAELELAPQIALNAIHAHTAITLQTHLLEAVLPVLPVNLEHRRAQLDGRACGQLQHALEHLARRTGGDRFLATRTIRSAKCS